MQWGIHPVWKDPTIEPIIQPLSPTNLSVHAGQTVRLAAVAYMTVPDDAQAGQTIDLILQATRRPRPTSRTISASC